MKRRELFKKCTHSTINLNAERAKKHLWQSTPVFTVTCMALFVFGCASPLNQATSNRYGEECSQAERSGRLDVAEHACYRALVNVDWGNLGPEQ